VATEETTEHETTGAAAEEGDATGVPQDRGTAQVEGINSGMNIETTGVLPEETISLNAPSNDDSDDEEEDQHDAYHPNTMTPSVQRGHRLRPRRARDYSHMFSHTTVMHHAMTQYSLKKGLQKFQKVG
jgi:hypothetical protein